MTGWIRGWGAADSPPEVSGRVLLLASGLIVAMSLPVLHPDTRQTVTALVVAAVVLPFLALSRVLPWARWPRAATLAFPVAQLAALGAVGWSGSSTGGAYRGLIIFAFMYVGLTQAPGAALVMVPPATGAYLLGMHHWAVDSVLRLCVAICVWVFVGELLAGRTSGQSRAAAALRRDALTDPLTGVGSRRAFDSRLPLTQSGDTIVIIDLDNFKAINDSDGHEAGDVVLAQFGAMLTASLRGEDFAARYGGEEFVAILHDTQPESALDVLGRMRRRWAATGASVTFSSGVALVTDDSRVQRALSAADEALYASKRGGRNCDHIAYSHIVRASI
jgi:diguanylate cyclase (GGDEF)-like protein